MPDPDEWLTTLEAARALDLSTDRVRALCREGRLVTQATKYGRLVSAESVAELRAAREARL